MEATRTQTNKTAVSLSKPSYPPGIPFKFDPDGVAQRYPGNTTICHVPTNSRLASGLHVVYETISSHPTLSRLIRLLPPESWHMTVLDGVRETECEPGMWPEGLEKKPLAESTREYSKSLRALGLELEAEGLAPPYRMQVRGFEPGPVGIGLDVVGATEKEERRMRRLRDRLADTLGF